MTAPSETLLKIDRLALLHFYDDPVDGERGMHATAFNAMAGEELGLALLMHYFAGAGLDAERLEGTCGSGTLRGHRLDAWVRTPKVLYQVEVKNWSSHSFSGTRFPLDAAGEGAIEHRRRIWREYWDATRGAFADSPADKVFDPMKAPRDDLPVEPLLALWVALHPDGEDIPFFTHPAIRHPFTQVIVFSMSTYLRSLTCDNLTLPLPDTRIRLAVLSRIFSLG